MAALDVLPPEKAKEHLQIRGDLSEQPGGDDEFNEMIGAAVERVRRHLGGREPSPTSHLEVLACKAALKEYWDTQRSKLGATRQSYGGAGAVGLQDDGPASAASLMTKLTALLGPPVAPAGEQPAGLFPPPQAWPDPVQRPIGGIW